MCCVGVEGETEVPYWSFLNSAITAAMVAVITQTPAPLLVCLYDHKGGGAFQRPPVSWFCLTFHPRTAHHWWKQEIIFLSFVTLILSVMPFEAVPGLRGFPGSFSTSGGNAFISFPPKQANVESCLLCFASLNGKFIRPPNVKATWENCGRSLYELFIPA